MVCELKKSREVFTEEETSLIVRVGSPSGDFIVDSKDRSYEPVRELYQRGYVDVSKRDEDSARIQRVSLTSEGRRVYNILKKG